MIKTEKVSGLAFHANSVSSQAGHCQRRRTPSPPSPRTRDHDDDDDDGDESAILDDDDEQIDDRPISLIDLPTEYEEIAGPQGGHGTNQSFVIIRRPSRQFNTSKDNFLAQRALKKAGVAVYDWAAAKNHLPGQNLIQSRIDETR